MRKVLLAVFLIAIINLMAVAQWIQQPSTPSGLINNIMKSDSVLYLSHSSNGVFKSIDAGLTWQLIINGLNNSEAKSVHEVLVFRDTLYAATVDGIYRSTNLGNLWVKKSSGITIGPGATAEFCESIFEYNGNLFTGAFNGIYRSTDYAENWLLTNVSGQHIWAKNFTAHNGILFAARENINFPNGYFSTDEGLTWNSLTTLNFPTITFFSEGTKLWSGTIHGVWLSTDNGVTWGNRSNGLSPDPYSSSIIRTNGNLITSLKFGGSGMFRSTDDGINWEDFGAGLPFLSSIEKLIVYSDKILAATSNGLWQRDTSETVTELIEQENLIDGYELFQNYPNPFNPATKIEFRIADLGFVSLKVFDALGNEIATLVDGEMQPGSYDVEFSATNLSSGISVRGGYASGVYFYKFQFG
ncbi:MAG TPA: hypothetical protein VIY47_03230 [Ignavibacteriaceae bacterium]